ncbi:MAG TPA: T9SS type A sorting domain-containing protein, partial [Candidatus Kapabacteria bacterium]|nr:T9SS type A sorting domain-containing protein [Candidatus Kapabacteria bacterium]
NNGVSWQASDNGLPRWTTINSMLPFAGQLFAEVLNNGNGCNFNTPNALYRSANGGNSWIKSDSGIPVGFLGQGNTTRGASDLLFSFSNNLFALGTGIYRSTDTGRTWFESDSGIAISLPWLSEVDAFLNQGGTLYASAGAYSDDRFIYGALFKSTDSGTTWSKTLNSPGFPVFILASSGSNIFAARYYTYGQPEGGLFLSSNGGNSWDSLPCPIVPASIAADRNSLFTAGRAGDFSFGGNEIYFSQDAGSTWKLVSEGEPFGAVTSLLVFNNYLYAGTWDSGVWRRPLSDFGISSVAQTPVTPTEIQSYPNPFSQRATITFTAESQGYADVRVVNLLGAPVVQLYSGELSAGEHEFSWDASGFAPGIYECEVRMNGQVQRISMAHVR